MRYALLLIMVSLGANATGNKTPPQPPTNLEQNQKAVSSASVGDITDVTTVTTQSYADGGNASQGISNSFNYEGAPADPVLVPNNNTENCLRVFGFAFGNRDGSAMLGIPWRSAKCDYEQAADDAFGAGERVIGYYWKCQNPNLYRRFKKKGMDAEGARDKCHEFHTSELDKAARIEALEQANRTLINEREIDRKQCNERVGRAVESCRSK